MGERRAPTPTSARPWPVRHRWPLAAAAALLLAAPPALLWGLLHSTAGSAWALRQVPGLEAHGLEGSLLGGHFSAARLQWQGEAGTLRIEQLRADGLGWHWLPAPGQWVGLAFDAVAATRVHWQPAAGPAPAATPTSLRLPLALDLPLQVGQLQWDAAAPLTKLRAHVRLGDAAGARHRVDDLTLDWAQGRVAATAQIDTDAPLAMRAQASVQSAVGAAPSWRAELQAEGPLTALDAKGTLAMDDGVASAEVTAKLTPFATLPLAALTLRTQALDLSRLDARLPHTALSGEARLVEPAAGRPLQARVALHNARPGRWNEQRLPVRSAQLGLQAAPDAPDRIVLSDMALSLDDGTGRAGHITGSGLWHGHALTLELQAAGLVPQRLDGRAPDWRVHGALGLEAKGLPSPDPDASAPAAPWQAVAVLALAGEHGNAPQPVQVQAEVVATAGRVELRRGIAHSGAARVQATGEVVRQAQPAGTAWGLRGQAVLKDLDPAPWWPGLGAAWQRGPHRLSARLDADLRLPANADWRRIGGRAELLVDDSLLAGVPLQGQAALHTDGALTLALQAGGNRVDAWLQPDRRAQGAGGAKWSDVGRVTINAAALERLAPWAALHPALAGLPRAGRVQAQGQWQGRWPDLSVQGSGDALSLLLADGGVDKAHLRVQAGTATDATLQAHLQLHGLRWQGRQLAHADLRLDGTPASHRLRLDVALPLLPPEALTRSLALHTAKGTRLGGRLDGRLLPLDTDSAERNGRTASGSGSGSGAAAPTAPTWRWEGRLASLGAGSWDGKWDGKWDGSPASDAAVPAPSDWVAVQPLQAEAEFDASGALRRLRADTGHMRVADAFTVTWDELRWREGSVQWQARLEDLEVAPLLDRWQPGMGWEGSLRVGGRLALSLGERTRIDAVIERQRGDLGMRESPEVSIPFGLSDLRLALQAQDGTWTFTQALAGRTLGELGGLVRVHSAPQARWPRAEDRLDGALIGRVANLGVWGAWVPPGWRLQGSVASQVLLGGSLGAPELRGTLTGDGLGLRNLLQGVHVHDGVVRLRLDGAQATIERFDLRGGDGRLALTGNATLGADPSAALELQAEAFHLLSRIDRRLVASGQARLTLAPQALTLRGRFGVDEGLFDASRSDAPVLDDDVVVQRAHAPAMQLAPAAAAPRQHRVDVAVDIDLGERLRVRGRGLDTRLAGSLRVSAPGGRLAVNGTVRTVAGTYAAYAQRLEVRRGELTFAGDPANPRLDVLALRPNLDIEVGVAITGGVQSPRVRLYSNPELGETDKLSWLVLGRDPGGLGRADTALLQRAAVALLAGEGQTPTDTLMRNLGLDEFSVRQDDDGSGGGDTVVSLGKQLSRRWYVGYERGVNATAGTWQLIYRVAQRFTLRAQSGTENALDAIWVWRVP